MGNSGIKISKPGVNVRTADPKDLVYSSAYNSLKIARNGTETATGTTVAIAHNLGYRPAYLAFVKYVSFGETGYRSMTDKNSYITDTELVCDVVDVGDIVSYMIFYDPVQTGVTNFTETKTKQNGVRISQTGNDVNTVSDTLTSFSSEFNTLQIRELVTSACAPANDVVIVTHDYGYIPAFMADIKRTVDGTSYYEPEPYIADAGVFYESIYCVSKTNTIEIHSGDTDQSGDQIRIMLFTESLE